MVSLRSLRPGRCCVAAARLAVVVVMFAPIASSTAVLEKLPYTFVEMAGTGPAADNFPRFTQPSDTEQVAANLASPNPSPMDLAWSAMPAPADNRAFRLFSFYEFFQGPKSTNSGGAFYPAYRLNVDDHPGSTATALAGKTRRPSSQR